MSMRQAAKQSNNKIFITIPLLAALLFSCNKEAKKEAEKQNIAVWEYCEVLEDISVHYYNEMLRKGDTIRIRMPAYNGQASLPACWKQIVDWVYNPNNDFEVIGELVGKKKFSDNRILFNVLILEMNDSTRQMMAPEPDYYGIGDTAKFDFKGYEVKRIGKYKDEGIRAD
jgi:hypothetical protein